MRILMAKTLRRRVILQRRLRCLLADYFCSNIYWYLLYKLRQKAKLMTMDAKNARIVYTLGINLA